MKFVKKPIPIDTVQWTGHNFDEIAILQDYVFVNEGNKRVLKHSTDIKAGDLST